MKSFRRAIRFLPIFAVMLIFLAPAGFAAGPADVKDETPQEGAKTLQISKIDASDPTAATMQFTYNGDPSKLTTRTLRENGTQLKTDSPQLIGAAGISRATVLVLDQSGSMVDHGGLATSVTKMKELIDSAPANDQFGLVTFGSQAQVVQEITTDRAKMTKALDSIKADPKAQTAMWDGVASGMALLQKKPNLQHNLVLVTDGTDDSSGTTAAEARGAVIGTTPGSGATVFALGITQENQLDKAGLVSLVAKSGGRLFITDKATNVAVAFDQVAAALKNEYVMGFVPLAKTPGRNNLSLNIGGAVAQASFTVGGVQSGASALAPQEVAPSSVPSFFGTTGGLLLGLLLIGFAVAIALFIAFGLVMSRTSELDAALSPYAEGYDSSAEDGDGEGNQSLGQTALLQRAVAMTESFAESRGFLETVEHKLELAEIPLKAAEVLLIWVVGLLLLTAVGFALGGFLIAFVLLLVGIVAGPAFLNIRSQMRQTKFQRQLPDMLTLMAGALRAGFSLMQAVDAVSVEVQDPMGRELRRVVSETRLGRDLEDALDDVAERTGSADFAWAVMAIRIQREVGGNLSELLMTVADTMIQRERLRREVKALTAEGRISAIVLALLSPALGVVMYIGNPEYMKPLFTDLMGQIMLALSLVGMIVGYLWMRKVVQIDV